MILGGALLFLMGITLGLIGAGGAILTLPILIYVFKIPPLLATTYSLFIVGLCAFFALIRHRERPAFKEAILFASPSLLGVALSRHLLPLLPSQWGSFSKDSFILGLLIATLFLASFFMVKKRILEEKIITPSVLKISSFGFILGMTMGVIGAGGGFLIIPTLVLFMGFDIKKAIPTSLLIITLNSTVGFLVDAHPLSRSDYTHLFFFATIGLMGLLAGSRFETKLSNDQLKKIFSLFVGTLATVMLIKELFF